MSMSINTCIDVSWLEQGICFEIQECTKYNRLKTFFNLECWWNFWGRLSHRVAVPVSWRLLVKGRIANIGLRWRNFCFVFSFDDFLCFSTFSEPAYYELAPPSPPREPVVFTQGQPESFSVNQNQLESSIGSHCQSYLGRVSQNKID